MRKRTDRSELWAKLLWLALAANLLAGLWFSELTRIRTVKIAGAEKPYRPFLASILSAQEGRPALQVDPESIESQAMTTSAVEHADFHRNVFGRATLRLRYRIPIAVFESDRTLFLDASGTVFRSHRKYTGLPKIDLFASGLRPTLALAGTWPNKTIAWLAGKSKNYDFGADSTIEVQAGGAVSLITQSKSTIRLGAPYELEEKLGRLDELLHSRPDLLQKAKAVNLVDPQRPTWTPR